MDNLTIKKIWQDGSLIELKIKGQTEYVTIFQNCYIEEKELERVGTKISDYVFRRENEYYIEFGEKEGNFTPAFSMKILPADMSGHVKIEVDFEIADNDARIHRACFYINCELGALDKFGQALKIMAEGKTTACKLYSEEVD